MKELRKTEIISLLEEHGFMNLKELSETLGVSEMTVRRDITELNALMITTLHKGVVSLNQDLANSAGPIGKDYTVEKANTFMINEKLRIAGVAADLVKSGDTVIIDNGTTMELLANALDKNKNLTVITSNFKVASRFVGEENINLSLTGGLYHRETAMFEGYHAVNLIKQSRANIGFVSALAIHDKLGITCSKTYEIPMKSAMIKSSFKRVLLADSSKFSMISSYHFADLEDFDLIISDRSLPQKYISLIENKGIKLILA